MAPKAGKIQLRTIKVKKVWKKMQDLSKKTAKTLDAKKLKTIPLPLDSLQ